MRSAISFLILTSTLRTFAAFLCVCFAVPASAKLDETVPQLIKRFGKSYTTESNAIGETYNFRSENVNVAAFVSKDVSVAEMYFSDHPLSASGEPPNDIVRTVLKTNAPQTRWDEIDAAPFGADYALQSSNHEYIALLRYTGPQPEGTVWTMTVGREKALRSIVTTAASQPSPVTTPLEIPRTTQEEAAVPTQAEQGPAVPAPASKTTLPTVHDLLNLQDKDLSDAFESSRKAAEQNDPIAQFRLGKCYANGQGVPKDYAEAMKWFRKAAEQNYAPAQLALAAGYDTGEGVPKDYAEAVKWFRKAAEQNLAPAQFLLGYSYYYGEGVPKDHAEAVKWYRKAAERGDPGAQGSLATCYYNGEGVPKDYAEAVKWFRKAAEQGHPDAQNALGFCYANGLGVPKDYAEAVKWYRKAAEQNYAPAQAHLGVFYDIGEGVPKDHTEAVKWFRKAAEQGHPDAQTALGACYTNGQGVRKNYAEAVRWFRKAAEQNVLEAQCNLGVCYGKGQGVPKDYAEAVKWFRKAAEQGHPDAQTALGFRYDNGQGVPKDYAEAVKWYRKAAEQNNASAQFYLSIRYLSGEGVPKDYVEAYKWMLLAAAGQTNEFLQKNVATMERNMTREQIAEGQSLARNFKPRKVLPARGDSSPIAIADSRPESTGTAFFITDDGYLITSGHVLGESTQVRLVTAAGTLPAKVVKVDAGNDLALLKAEGTFEALPVVESRAIKLGSTVLTVGFPNLGLQGFAPKLSRGEIGSLAGFQDDPRYFQISAPVQPGNSGGALVDEHGNVIGVVAAKLSAKATLLASGALPENVNYAVKSSFLRAFLESVPQVATKLKEPNTAVIKSEDVVERAEKAAALALVY